jgi:glycosyltransferase involved in cell wall biosynthesis
VKQAIATAAQGPQGPSYRVRLMIPAPELRRHGVSLVPLPLLTREQAAILHTGSPAARARVVIDGRRRFRRGLRPLGDIAAVVVQRQVDPLPGRRLERTVTHGRALILDVDDAIWLPQPGGHPLTRLRRNPSKLRWLATRAEHVIAGNDHLAEWLAPHARNLSVVPSLVDTAHVAPRQHADSDTIVLGWIGSPTTARYLHGIVAALAAFAAARPAGSVTLIVVGGPAPTVPGARVEQWTWSEEQETRALATMDIGLMPLPDDPWTRGKCAYKALQYMAAGVPVVADDVGVTGRVVGDGSGGLLAAAAADWPHALRRLADSAALRARLGAAGRARVEDDFSVRAWGARLAAIIAGAA